MKKLLLLAAFCLSCGLAFAENTVVFKMDADQNALLFDGGGSFYDQEAYLGQRSYLITGRARLMSLKKINIEPDRKYRVVFNVKALGSQPANIYGGWICYDKQGKVIPSQAFHAISNSIIELEAPAAKGATSVKIKDGSKWRNRKGFYIAFNAAADGSDLPNYNFCRISGVEQKSGEWIVNLAEPLKSDYEAGTLVRQHVPGGDFFFCSDKTVMPGNWQKIESIWFVGKTIRRAASVKLVFIVNLPDKFKNSKLLIDEVEFLAEGGNISF